MISVFLKLENWAGKTLFNTIRRSNNYKTARSAKQIKGNKNALAAAFSLPCLHIRSRNKEAINSTRNRIYSLKVFYFLLYQRRYFLFVSELI